MWIASRNHMYGARHNARYNIANLLLDALECSNAKAKMVQSDIMSNIWILPEICKTLGIGIPEST